MLWNYGGINLGSTVGGRLTRIQSSMVNFTPYVQGVVLGLVLSDGNLGISNGSKNARLGFKQSLEKSKYFWFVFNTLSHYCGSLPYPVTETRKDTKTHAWAFFTRTLPCFKELHSIFYEDRKKVVPKNIF